MGTLDFRKLRTNNYTHPLQAVNGFSWRPAWGTRLRGYFEFNARADEKAAEAAGVQVLNHDDWDCLADLAAAGWVDLLSTANGYVKLTELGKETAAALMKHKAGGGMFATFPGV